ncbi:MAG: hypothetical protein ACREME_11375, partial [Gemmatimonadales bacterium]
ACRREIHELRSTISAVSGLPEEEPPRSFALTPATLERGSRVRPIEPAPPVAVGMRLTGAAVAAVLAVLVVGDLGGIGGGNSDDQAGGGQFAERSAQLESTGEGDTSADGAQAPAATSLPEADEAAVGANRASPSDTAGFAGEAESCPVAADSGTGGGTGAGGAGGPASAASPTAERVPTPSPAIALSDCPPIAGGEIPETEAPEAAAELRDSEAVEGGQAAASPAGEDGGVSPLTVLEIVLAGALVALLGGIAIEVTLRRRRAA